VADYGGWKGGFKKLKCNGPEDLKECANS